jgi:hypothetical protein
VQDSNAITETKIRKVIFFIGAIVCQVKSESAKFDANLLHFSEIDKKNRVPPGFVIYFSL